jgi:membrane fusion protein, multidrug efflux system
VWLMDASSMTVKLQPVSVAGADGNEAVISTGLKPGDVVVTAGVHVLKTGQKVKWLQEPPKAASGANASQAAAGSNPAR